LPLLKFQPSYVSLINCKTERSGKLKCYFRAETHFSTSSYRTKYSQGHSTSPLSNPLQFVV